MKFKTMHAFGSRKRSMKFVRMAKSDSARPTGDDDRVDMSHNEFTAAPAVAEEAFVAASTQGPASSLCAAGSSEIASTSFASATMKEKPSSRVHLRTHFLTQEEIEAAAVRRDAVQTELSSTSATERKLQAMQRGPTPGTVSSATSTGAKFLLIQTDVLNELLCCTVCKNCLESGLAIREGTQLGLALKLEVVCPRCGIIADSWSSPRQQDSRAFEVNIRAMMAVKQIGKGQTALNDLWAAMNVSHRGLHHKTFQEHLKNTFKEPEAQCLEEFYSESASAVKTIYKEMDSGFHRDVTIMYDGTWHKRGYTSHIGVGAVIEYHTGLILDAVVLSNLCLGCQIGPKPGDQNYHTWHQHHICQKNTDAKSGQMEVEAALILFKRSISKHDLRYTTLVSDGDSRTFSALSQENVYGIVPIIKEECLNHVQKRMGTALRNIVQKSDKPLGGKGKLTKVLIDKLTGYYGWALRNNCNDLTKMQRAVMATYYHVTSTDKNPHHELCPDGSESWCQHRVAEAKSEPQPQHKYNLPAFVAEAMLPVYQRLSERSLLERCMGARTQNASESFHSVLWSLMPKEQHASLIAVETALHEAVLRFNAGLYRATETISEALGLKPAHLALRRAAEKDAMRVRKANKRQQAKTEQRKNKRLQKDTSDYSAGAF